jgi:RNA polymerase sigma-70 factor (ECF subfamily)
MQSENTDVYEAFLGQFTANEAALRAYVRRLVPTRHDAADVMQGIALVLWKKFGDLDSPEDFRRWAFGVARYETLSWLRDRARDRSVLAQDLLETIASEALAMDERLEAQREALEDCLEKLPIDQRTLILEAYAAEVRIQDVAERSGRTVGGFYQWLHRTRLRLLECTQRTIRAEGLL